MRLDLGIWCIFCTLFNLFKRSSLLSVCAAYMVNFSIYHSFWCFCISTNVHCISLQTQEFLVLGSQVLTELKDRIYCLTDKLMEMAGEHDPSGYFLIEVSLFSASHLYV